MYLRARWGSLDTTCVPEVTPVSLHCHKAVKRNSLRSPQSPCFEQSGIHKYRTGFKESTRIKSQGTLKKKRMANDNFKGARYAKEVSTIKAATKLFAINIIDDKEKKAH